MRIPRTQSGFSLLEMVVYIALFSTLSLTVTNSMIQTVRGFNYLRASRDVDTASVLIMERLTLDIKNATSVDVGNSTFGATPGRLTLNVTNASGTPMTVEYYVLSNNLRIKEAGVDVGSLMSSAARIESLKFFSINTGGTSGVKIELQLKSTRGVATANDNFYNTAMLRGTY